MKTIMVSDEHHELLMQLSRDLRGQNSRATRCPLFLVQEKTVETGYDPQYACDDQVAWLDVESDYHMYRLGDATAEEEMREMLFEHLRDHVSTETEEVYRERVTALDLWSETEVAEVKDSMVLTGYKESWRTRSVHFTEAGARHHLKLNGHNYNRGRPDWVRIYAAHIHRSPDMSGLRDFLMSLTGNDPVEERVTNGV